MNYDATAENSCPCGTNNDAWPCRLLLSLFIVLFVVAGFRSVRRLKGMPSSHRQGLRESDDILRVAVQ